MLDQIANKITPDQENVYYSFKSLRDALTGLVGKTQLESLVTQTKKFYLPVFVLDASDITNIIIDVYQRPYVTNLESTIVITPTSVTLTNPVVKPTTTVPIPSDEVDKGVSIDLSNSFHSENNITETTWKTNSDTVDDRQVEIIASTKSWYDEEIFVNKKLNSKIFVNLVKETLKNLPSKTLELYQKTYQGIEEEIDALLQLLTDAQNVKELSIDKLKISSLLGSIYDNKIGREIDQEYLQELVIQAFYDLYGVQNHIGKKYAEGSKRSASIGENGKLEFTKNPIDVGGPSQVEIGFRAAWNGVLSLVNGVEKREISPKEENPNTYIVDLLEVNGRSVFKDDSILNEWFESNLYKKVSGKEASFASLSSYIATFKSKTSEAFSYFNSQGGAGAAILLEQAVYKSILELCESNVNVTNYSAKSSKGVNIFSVHDRNGVLGPSECFPWPSPPVENRIQPIESSVGTFSMLNPSVLAAAVSSIGDITVTQPSTPAKQSVPAVNSQNRSKVISPFSKNGFLCFHPLIHELKEIFSMPTETIDWLVDNLLTTTNSDLKIANSIREHFATLGSQGNPDDILKAFSYEENSASNAGYWRVYSRPNIKTYYETPERPKSYFQWHSKGGSIVPPETASTDDVQFQVPSISTGNELNFGWGSSENPANDISSFYEKKLYNLPNLLNTTIALTRAIVYKTIEKLIQSYRSITSDDVNITSTDVLNGMTHENKGQLLSGISTILENIIENNTGKVQLVLNFDGTKSVVWDGPSPTGNSYQTNDSFKDTVGRFSLSSVCADYVQFVSKISSNDFIKLVAEPGRKLVPVSDYIPIEAMASESNPNFEQNWGSSSQYFDKNTVQSTWDLLEFTEEEFTKNILLKKETSAINDSEVKTSSWNVGRQFLDRFSIFYKHINLLTNFIYSLETFVNDVNMIQPNDKITKLYENGLLDETYSLSDPKNTIRQIISKRKDYACDTDGIARRIENAIFNLPSSEEVIGTDLIYVLGLPNDLWQGEREITLVPYFYGFDSAIGADGIQLERTTVDVDGVEKTEPIKFNISYSKNQTEGQKWLNYLHIIRGIDIGPHSFSSKGMPIYEESIVKNDAGIFNWKKEDFIDQVPILPLDTMWTMSPWLFPRNYFYDVVENSKYHKIVVCTISKSDIAELGSSANFFNNSNVSNLIGSIQWQVEIS